MTQPIDLNAAAAALYNNSPQPSTVQSTEAEPKQETADTSREDAAKALYGNTAAGLRPDGLDKVYHTTQRDIISASTERFGIEEGEAKEIAQHWGTTFSTYGIDPSEASTLAEVGAAALANPPDEATFAAWGRDARAAVKTEFGATADLAIADAQRLIAGNPQLHAFLEETGLGNHPHVVLSACNAARRARTSGRLK